VDVHSAQPVHARHRDGPDRRHDRAAPGPADRRARRGRALRAGLLALTAALLASAAGAETLRLAVFHTDLSRRGPGILLADIVAGDDAQVLATERVIAAAEADVLLLLNMDFDAGRVALDALAERLAAEGHDYPHRLSLMPNSGRPTGVDLDGDGRTWRARDAVGYGLFTGDGGMALLSRHPIGAVRDFSDMPWVALPGATAPEVTPAEVLETLPLHTVGAWDVQVLTPSGPFHVLASDATPPVFDGPEDRNGLRNMDELRFWAAYLDGWTPEDTAFAGTHFAVMGSFQVDPERGEGRREGLRALLDHPALQDPDPRAPGGGTATADWPEPRPGDLRVDYVLPARALRVTGAGILWPEADAPLMGLDLETAAAASEHRLVWVDVALP
jgi:hypothetical protein